MTCFENTKTYKLIRCLGYLDSFAYLFILLRAKVLVNGHVIGVSQHCVGPEENAPNPVLTLFWRPQKCSQGQLLSRVNVVLAGYKGWNSLRSVILRKSLSAGLCRCANVLILQFFECISCPCTQVSLLSNFVLLFFLRDLLLV